MGKKPGHGKFRRGKVRAGKIPAEKISEGKIPAGKSPGGQKSGGEKPGGENSVCGFGKRMKQNCMEYCSMRGKNFPLQVGSHPVCQC